jgi:flagellar M-ring protein FliF
MSVAVLVDHNIRWEQNQGGTRRVVEPPAPETLKAIRELASAAVGLNPERGDQITVEALPFESTLTQEPPASQPEREPGAKVASPEWLKYLQDPKNLRDLGAGALLLVLIAAMLFYLRRNHRRVKAELARKALPAPQSVNNDPLAVSKGAPPRALATGSEAELAALMGALQHAVQKDSIGAAGALRTWLGAEK